MRHSRSKLLGFHVVGITSERFISPCRIQRSGDRFPAPAQFGRMNIADTMFSEGRPERVLIKVWVTARPGEAPHIRDQRDPMRSDQGDKVVQRPIGMADGPNRMVRTS